MSDKMTRHMQRLTSITLCFLFMKMGREAAENGNETGRMICRIGMLLNAVAQRLMVGLDISDLVKLTKENK